MLKKLSLFLVGLMGTQSLWGMLPSCRFVRPGKDKTEIIELKSNPNDLSLVQISAITLPDRTPYDLIRLVNADDPSKDLFLGFRCDWGQSQLFRNATDKPAHITCYRCEGNTSALTCPNNNFLAGDIEAATPAKPATTSSNYTARCKPVDCGSVLTLTKCERSNRLLTEKDNRDKLLGLIETPQAKRKR